MSDKQKLPETITAFHAHLDECEHCRLRPFDLCSTGSRLLHEAAVKSAPGQLPRSPGPWG